MRNHIISVLQLSPDCLLHLDKVESPGLGEGVLDGVLGLLDAHDDAVVAGTDQGWPWSEKKKGHSILKINHIHSQQRNSMCNHRWAWGGPEIGG